MWFGLGWLTRWVGGAVIVVKAAAGLPHSKGGSMSWDPVYRLVKQIPRGRVITYGALAKALRLRGGARTAGRAMAATPSGKGIPWHRVVGDRGKLLIPEPYGSLQTKMLQTEGVELVEFRVDLKKFGWTPGVKSSGRVGRSKKG